MPHLTSKGLSLSYKITCWSFPHNFKKNKSILIVLCLSWYSPILGIYYIYSDMFSFLKIIAMGLIRKQIITQKIYIACTHRYATHADTKYLKFGIRPKSWFAHLYLFQKSCMACSNGNNMTVASVCGHGNTYPWGIISLPVDPDSLKTVQYWVNSEKSRPDH